MAVNTHKQTAPAVSSVPEWNDTSAYSVEALEKTAALDKQRLDMWMQFAEGYNRMVAEQNAKNAGMLAK